MDKRLFSIIIPVYQNELNLPITIPNYLDYAKSISEKYDVELIFIDDGSLDNSYNLLKSYQGKAPNMIKIIKLTRNFGQYYAMMAGFSYAKGDIIGKINADMQEPIELFSQMLEKYEEGNKIVLGARKSREDKGLSVVFAKIIRFLESKLINKDLPKGGTDFYIFDKEVLIKLNKIKQRSSSIPALLLWMGYTFETINYVRKEREHGKSAWTFSKKIAHIIDTYTTNSSLPLKFISLVGLFVAIIAFFYGGFIIVKSFFTVGENEIQGWRSIVVLISFFSGLILLSLGIIGEYIWKMFDYIKDRPSYIIEEVLDESNK